MKKHKRLTKKVVHIALPETVPFSDKEEDWTTHVLICRQCGARRYTDARLASVLEELKTILKDEDPTNAAWPRHKPCKSIMYIERLGEEVPV